MARKLNGLFLIAVVLILSSVFSGFFGSIGTSAWQLLIQGDFTHFNPFQIGIIVSFVIGFIILLYASYLQMPKSETSELPTKGLKKTINKLRVHFKAENRINALLTGITFLIMGPVMIFMFSSFSAPDSIQNATAFNATKYTSVAIGVFVCGLGAWMSTNLLLDIFNARQKAINDRNKAFAHTIKDFSTLSANLQKLYDTNLKLETLHELQDNLCLMCKNYEWYQVKKQIMSFLNDLIPEKISVEPFLPTYLTILRIITAYFNKETIQITSKKWRKELETIYDDQNWLTTTFPDVLYLLQEINYYSFDYLMKLVDDSVKDSTKKLKFDEYLGNINFSALKSKNEDDYDKLLSFILLKLDSAKRTNEDALLVEKLTSLRTKAKNA